MWCFLRSDSFIGRFDVFWISGPSAFPLYSWSWPFSLCWPNCRLTNSSSHRRHFRSLRYNCKSHLSMNLVTCLAQRNFCFHILYATPLPNSLTPDVLTQRYSQHWSFHCFPSCNKSLFFFLRGSPCFACLLHHRQNSIIEEIRMPLPWAHLIL